MARADRARGPLPALLAPIAWCAARVYGFAVARRNKAFDAGRGVHALEVSGRRVPVISVGNLSAGGTGKSPLVAWIAVELARSGSRPVIALRGYRAARDARGVVHSDEADEYETTAPEAKVVVGARRREELLSVLGSAASEAWRPRAVVVLDDGFQHRQLARDLDIVLVDATRPALDGDVLPLGWLREGAEGIRRADVVILTKAHDADARDRAAALVARARGRPHDAVCEHRWPSFTLFEAAADGGGEPRPRFECPIDALDGRTVVSACALGNPSHFHGMVERAGMHIAARLERADHMPFTAVELDRAVARARAELVITSRKDLVKLDRLPEAPLVVPDLSIGFSEGEDRVRASVLGAVAAASADSVTRLSARSGRDSA
ncbi:MAG: tetraacyldisaccharide 4'-kinase [Planctomycetaceae bacterium]|nr:tetraacyldisaccharide 4'-kinase [Planctomycetaceae bacterium]